MINNIVLFGVSAFFLYKNIQKQQYQLKISEAQYRSLFESNPNPMWVFHKNTHVFIAVNDAAVAKYGFSRNEFSGMTIWDIRPSEEHERLAESLKVAHQGAQEMGAWRHIKKSGELFWVSIVTHDIFFDQQPCTMVMATDMTAIILNEENVFALKFYAKKDRRSDYKYSKLTNKGDVGNILITCLKVIPLILMDYPNVSFGFVGSRTIDKASRTVEDFKNNQRFRVYRKIVEKKVGFHIFEHFTYEFISGYLLINKHGQQSIENRLKAIIKMFADTYQDLPGL